MKRVSSKLSIAAALALGATASFGALGDYFVDLPNGDWVLVGIPGFAEPLQEVTACEDMTTFATGNAYGTAGGSAEDFNISDGSGAFCAALSETDYNDSIRVSSVDMNSSVYFVDIFAVSSDDAYDTNMSAWTGADTLVKNNPTITFDPIVQTTFGSGKSMFVRVSSDSKYTDLIQIRFDDKYTGQKFNLSVDGNETFYQYTFGPDKTVYLENTSTSTGKVSEDYGVYLDIDMNKSKSGQQYFNQDINGTDSGDMEAIGVGAVLEHNLSVWTFENKTWRKFQTLSGNVVSKDFNVTMAGAAYWYELYQDVYGSNREDDSTYMLSDNTLSAEDINVSDSETAGDWVFTALPTGEFINSQTALISTCANLQEITTRYGEEINTTDVAGTVDLTKPAGARALNGLIRAAMYQDLNDTVNLPIRAYPTSNAETLIVGDVDFNISCTGAAGATTAAGAGLTSGYSIYGEQALVFHVSQDLLTGDGNGTGMISIEIPNISDDAFEINLSRVASLTALEDNITKVLGGYEMGATGKITVTRSDEALNLSDFNVTRIDVDLDGVYDDFLIAIKSPEYRTGTYAAGDDSNDYTNEYLRFGVREDSYVKIYEVNATYDFTGGAMKPDTTKNLFSIQNDDLEIGKARIYTGNPGSGHRYIDINVSSTRTGYQWDYNLTNSYIEINNSQYTSGTPDINQSVFLYLITNNRFTDIYEINATSYGTGRHVPLDSNESFRVLKNITYSINTEQSRDSAYTTSRYGEDVQIDTNKSRGFIAEVYTLDKLTGDATISGTADGNVTTTTPSVYDLKANTVWSAAMPNTGPLYELAKATDGAGSAPVIPSEIWTYKNKRWFDIKFEKDPTTWLNDFTLFRVGAVDGFWVKIKDRTLPTLTAPTTTVETTIELIEHYDVKEGKTYNIPFADASIDNIQTSLSGFFNGIENASNEKLLLNASVGGSEAVGYFDSVGNIGAYHVTVNPYTYDGTSFTDDTTSGTGIASIAVALSDGMQEVSGTDIVVSAGTKLTAPTITISGNVVNGASTTTKAYVGYINDANTSDTEIELDTDDYTIKPTDINITDWTSSLEMNLTKLHFVEEDTTDLVSDITSVEYLPLFSMKWGTVGNTVVKSGGRYDLKPSSGDDSNLTLVDTEGQKVGNSATTTTSDYLINILNIMQTATSTDYVTTATRYITDESGTTLATAASSYTDNGTTYTVDSTNSNGIQLKSLVSGASVSLAYKPEPGLTSGNTPANNFVTFYDDLSTASTTNRVAIATIAFPDDYQDSKFFLYYDNNKTVYSGIFNIGRNTTLGMGSSSTTDSNLTTVRAGSGFSF
jgi:hypothetical protein